MIVDDEKFNCNILCGFLASLGYKDPMKKVSMAYDGQQAVNHFLEAVDENDPYRYSLVLMDCVMPNLDGYEATKQIRSILSGQQIAYADQPQIIAVTGNVEDKFKQKAADCGMDRVLPKPCPIKELGKILVDMGYIEADKIPQRLRL